MANPSPCQSKHLIASVLTLVFLAQPACAYYFQGYYCPQILVSPMRDHVIYTPVGLGIVTSRAGFRVHPVTHRGDFHNGVDLAARLNDKVYCLLDGLVTRVGWRGNLGVAVEVYHPYPNIRTIVGHLNAYSVRPGEWVTRGRVIGYAGSTGRSTGVHVHYTVVQEGTRQYIDPYAFLLKAPEYVVALKTARIRALAARNAQAFKAAPPKPIEDEEDHSQASLPKKEESAPPDVGGSMAD